MRRVRESGPLFDWLDRVEPSTETPKTGPLRLGELVVEEIPSGRIVRGAEGIELIWRNVPAFAPFRLLFRVPSFRRKVEKEVSGCEGNACEISPKRQ